MSLAPTTCRYCDGADPNCGFCEMGVPLDTQEDRDQSWGRLLDEIRDIQERVARMATSLRDRGVHVGMGSPPRCVTCQEAWPCEGAGG